MGRALVALLLALLVGPGAEAEPPRAPTVDLDFTVTDANGRPITDLQAHEIEIVVAERPTTIAELRFIAPDAHRGTRDSPTVALFLDEYHVAPEATGRVRSGLARLIAQWFAPGDRVVVVKPPESLTSLDVMDIDETLSVVSTFEGRKGDFSPRTTFERDYLATDPARIEAARAQMTLSVLQSVAFHLGRNGPGRRAVIVVSEGFMVSDGFAPVLAGHRRSALPSLESVLRASSVSGVSFHLVEPRALDPGAAPVRGETGPPKASGGREALVTLAAESGGMLARSADELERGWQRLVDDLRGYYIATFPGVWDGRFHAVRVEVRRPGARVRARRGYWARLHEDAWTAGKPLALAGAPSPRAMLPAPRSSRLVRPWFGLSRGEAGTTRVTFAWEPTPLPVGERRQGLPAARVALTAYGNDGRELFRAAVRPSGSSVGTEPAVTSFDVPPGRLRVQLAVEDAAARLLDTDVRDVVVASLGPVLAIGTPAVIRTRTARERRAIEADLDAAPTTSRDFTRHEQLLVRAPVYSEEPPTVTASLVGRSGRMLRTLTVSRRDGSPHYEIDLPLAPFAIGEYAIQLTALAAGQSLQELVAFRVVP